MKLRPFHIWWMGVLVFVPAVLTWITVLGLTLARGMFDCPLGWYGIRHIYLPLVAAIVGAGVPVVCLRVLRNSRSRVWISAFLIYVAVMLAWGIIDIRCENYQLGGHRYPDGPLVDGHRYYFHQYYTWYFMPYRWIERGIDGSQAVGG